MCLLRSCTDPVGTDPGGWVIPVGGRPHSLQKDLGPGPLRGKEDL